MDKPADDLQCEGARADAVSIDGADLNPGMENVRQELYGIGPGAQAIDAGKSENEDKTAHLSNAAKCGPDRNDEVADRFGIGSGNMTPTPAEPGYPPAGTPVDEDDGHELVKPEDNPAEDAVPLDGGVNAEEAERWEAAERRGKAMHCAAMIHHGRGISVVDIIDDAKMIEAYVEHGEVPDYAN